MREARLEVDGRDVARLLVADTALGRLRGMLGRRTLPEALLLRPGNSVHGVGMLRSLDVALLGPDLTVRRVLVLRPWGVTRPRRGVVDVLEAPRGAFARWGLAAGSRLAVREPT